MKDAGSNAAVKAERHGSSNGLSVASSASSAHSLMVAAAKSQKKMWDAGSLLIDTQREALESLAEFVAIRPLPKEEWRIDRAADDSQSATESLETQDAALPDRFGAVAELYRLLAESEAAGSEEEFEDVIDQQRRLKGMLALCDTILEKLSSVEGSLVSLQNQHDSVVSKTSAVHSECEKLTAEKTELESLAKAIHNRLAHYDEFESLQRQLALPTMQVASPAFLPLLTKIDEAIAHLATNAHFENTAVYLGRFRQLQHEAAQAKAMSMVKGHVASTLAMATERVHAVLKETVSVPSTPSGAAGGDTAGAQPGAPRVESALIAYVQYQAVAEGVKSLMMEMARRAGRSWEYGEVLEECQEIYFKQRQSILHVPTVAKVHAALSGNALGEGLRISCIELCDLCHREHKLMQHFFPPMERGGLPILLEPLCTELVDAVRPMFLKITSVEELCGLALILKGEVLEDRIEIRGESLGPMRACVSQLLNEVQERLTFRSQVYIRDEIHGYAPARDDLDYPARLQLRGTGGGGSGGGGAGKVGGEKGEECGEWCPVLPRTLAFLSQLYRTVDTKIFEGLAQDAVNACTEALMSCSKAVGKQRGPADGGLFLVMHLLKLREQIVPFDVDFSSTELNLDFSDTRSALASLISSRRSIFSWSTNNALLSLAKAPPRVYHTLRNAKKDLERELKHACEGFILLSASQVAEPCVAWVHKADALIPAGAAAARVSSLREHAFAQPDKVKELMVHLKRAVGAFNAETVAKMAQYLANPQTRSVLLTPIRNNIVDAYARMHTYLLAEYQTEEYIAMGVLTPEELAAALGGHQVVLLTADPPTPLARDDSPISLSHDFDVPPTESLPASPPAPSASQPEAARPSVGAATDLKLSAGPLHVAPAAAAAPHHPNGRSAQRRNGVAEAGRGGGVETGAGTAENGGGIAEADRRPGGAKEEPAERQRQETAARDKAAAEAAQAREVAQKEAAAAAARAQAERDAGQAAAAAAAETAAKEKAEREARARETAALEKQEREAAEAARRAEKDHARAEEERAEREARETAAQEAEARERAAREEREKEETARAAREAKARDEARAAEAREEAGREEAQVEARALVERQARDKAQRDAQAAAAAAAAASTAATTAAGQEHEAKEGGDEYGPWTGFDEAAPPAPAARHDTNNTLAPHRGALAPASAASGRPPADGYPATGTTAGADSGQGAGAVDGGASQAAAGRPLGGLHRGARPLAGLHRGGKSSAAAVPTGIALGGSGLGGSVTPPDLAAAASGLLPASALAAGAPGLLPAAALSGGSGVGGVTRLLGANAASAETPLLRAAPVFGGGQLPPGFKLVDGELKYVGQ